MADFIFDLQRFISNYNSNSLVSGASGNDTIYNHGDNVTINGNAGDDQLTSFSDSSKVTINGGTGNDTIHNWSAYSPIDGGDGADYLYAGGNNSYSTINGGYGNDSIINYGKYNSIFGGADSDTIENTSIGNYSTLNGGSGNDSISNSGSNVTIEGGTGDDTVSLHASNNLIKYSSGDGNDIIYGFNDDDTLRIGNGTGTYSSQKSASGSDIIITVGTGKITLQGAVSLGTVNIEGTEVTKNITLTESNDTYDNYIDGVTIQALGGNDSVKNYDSSTSVSIDGGAGNDYLLNFAGKVTISGNTGEDTLYSYGGYSSKIDGGTGNDHILNGGNTGNSLWGTYATLIGGEGDDSIFNWSDNVTISGGTGKDTINNNSGSRSSIDAGAGNDYLKNFAGNVTISGNTGDDTILTYGGYSSKIDGGTGNDNILNGGNEDNSLWGTGATLIGGEGDDSISNWSNTVTISGGTGKDTIENSGANVLFKYVSGDGNDSIVGFNDTSTLQIDNGTGTYSSQKSGSDIIVTVGDSKITLTGVSSLSSVNIDGIKVITGDDVKSVSLSEGNDTFDNTLANITINALGGNDYITNGTYGKGGAAKITINCGAGSDTVYNYGDSVLINGGTGIDYIYNNGTKVTISGGDGNDYIDNWSSGAKASINGGAGNDSITNNNNNVTVTGGTGNDSIRNLSGSSNTLFKYTSGDGNDTISGFNETSTLQIGGGTGTYSSQTSGSDIIVTVGDSKITLQGATSLSAVNIDGTEEKVEKDSWQLNGTTATYGTASKTLATVKGVTSLNGLSVKKKVITVSKKSLGTGKVKLSGDGYTLKLGSDVDNPTTEKAGWDFDKLKATAVYNQTTSAGYTLASDAKSISYSDEITKTLATVKGVTSADGLSVKKKVITVSKKSLGTSKVKLDGDGYTLKLGSDVTQSKTEIDWSFSGSTAGYNQITSKGYTLASDAKSITYLKKATSTVLATVKGVTSSDGLSVKKKVITVSKASLGTSKVKLDGDGYTLKLGSGADNPTTQEAAWTLKNSTATYKSSYKTAGYTLASNAKSITYTKATTPETLATVKGAKSTDGLKVSGKVITLENSALKNKVTVSGGYEFDFASDYKKATITGSSGSDTITARGSKISVNGGKGNDTIKMLGTGTVTGGAGKDIFYYKSSGANVISDYAEEDTVSIASGTADISTSGNDVIFNGKITVTGGADKVISYVDKSGRQTYTNDDHGVRKAGKVITLTENYFESNFNLADYDKTFQTVDASDVQRDLKITGNEFKNKITGSPDDDIIDGGGAADTLLGGTGNDSINGGKGNDSIVGGKDNDTLTGGAGADIFFYSKGDGKDLITDYAEEDSIIINSDTISKILPSKNKKDIVFTLASKGTITIAKGINKTITYTDADGEHIYPEPEVIEFNGKGTGVTLTSDYYKKEFDIADCKDHENNKDYKNAVTINGSAVNQDIEIIANQKNNKIYGGDGNDTISGGSGNDKIYGGKGADSLWGGKGDDTLYGGDGSDTFVYGKGEGNDVIADFTSIDQIMILSGKVKGYSVSDSNVTFNVDGGQITVTKGSDKYIELVDKSGNYLTHYEQKK